MDREPLPELSEERKAIAEQLVSLLGLEKIADQHMVFGEHSSTVRDGLGRCYEHFADQPPELVREIIDRGIEQFNQQER